MEDIRGVRLCKFNLRKIILGVRMHFHHKNRCFLRRIQEANQRLDSRT